MDCQVLSSRQPGTASLYCLSPTVSLPEYVNECQPLRISLRGMALFQNQESPDNGLHRGLDFDVSVALSNSVTRASMSSISIALAAWFITHSAARTLVEAGVFWSTMIFSSVDAAARGLLQPRYRLRECVPAGLSVGRAELRRLHPPQERVGTYRGNPSGVFDASLREQGRDRYLFLPPEFCAMSHHLTPSATIWPRICSASPILRQFRFSAEFACLSREPE